MRESHPRCSALLDCLFAAVLTCQTAKVRGASSVSPKSLTVNTITPRIGGQPGAARPLSGRRGDSAGPCGAWRSSLSAEPATTSRVLATTRHISAAHAPACAGGVHPPLAPGPLDRAGSADGEAVVTPARCVPDLGDTVHAAGRVVGPGATRAAVGKSHVEPSATTWTRPSSRLRAKPTQAADLQGVCPGEPAEAHSLYPAAHPGDQPYILVHGVHANGPMSLGPLPPLASCVPSRPNESHMKLTRSGEVREGDDHNVDDIPNVDCRTSQGRGRPRHGTPPTLRRRPRRQGGPRRRGHGHGFRCRGAPLRPGEPVRVRRCPGGRRPGRVARRWFAPPQEADRDSCEDRSARRVRRRRPRHRRGGDRRAAGRRQVRGQRGQQQRDGGSAAGSPTSCGDPAGRYGRRRAGAARGRVHQP